MNRLFTLILLSYGIFAASLQAQRLPDQRPDFLIRPYLQYSTQTEITILWETSHPASSLVEYGKSRFNTGKAILDEKAGDVTLKHLHKVTLTPLAPETNYFYKVSSVTEAGDTIQSDVSPFKTAVHKDSPFAFTLFSDSQNNPAVWKKITTQALEERPNFALHAGDLVGLGYRKEEWINEFFAPAHHFMKQIPIFSTLGNHEHDAAFYYQYMKNPEPAHYYTFSYGNADFFMIDTDQYQEPGTPLHQWLERALATSSATWKFVVQHHPPYSSEENDYGNTLYESSQYGDDEAKLLVPLFEKYGVDMVFSGHLHMYERTWPIHEGKVVEKNGVIYLILGGSGGSLEKAAPNRTWFTNKVRTLHHYAYIAINGNELQYQAIDQDGNLFDHFTLKGGRAKKSLGELPPTTPITNTKKRIFIEETSIDLSTANPSDEIFYSLDRSIPSRKSIRYKNPIKFTETAEIKTIAYNKNGQSGIGEYKFEKTSRLSAGSVTNPKQGINYVYYTGELKEPTADLSSQLTKHAEGVIDKLDLDLLPRREHNWGAELSGYLEVPETGYYQFKGHAYQLFRFYLHDQIVLDEYNREVDVRGEVFLEKGIHPFKIEYHLPGRYNAYWQFEIIHPSGKKQDVSKLNFYLK